MVLCQQTRVKGVPRAEQTCVLRLQVKMIETVINLKGKIVQDILKLLDEVSMFSRNTGDSLFPAEHEPFACAPREHGVKELLFMGHPYGHASCLWSGFLSGSLRRCHSLPCFQDMPGYLARIPAGYGDEIKAIAQQAGLNEAVIFIYQVHSRTPRVYEP